MAVKFTNASSSTASITFGEQEYKPGFGTNLTSFINSRTVMRGAAQDWDAERITKRMTKLEQIGGEHHFLKTRTGDEISSFHFTVDNFHQALTEMGGKPVSIELQMNHPFFETAQPVILTKADASRSVPGMRIPYTSELEPEFRNPQDFLNFCDAKMYEVVWEDTLEPFTTASWWHWNSRKQNLILMPKLPAQHFKNLENPSTVRIEKSDEIDSYFTFFEKKPMTSSAYVFEGDPTAIQKLFFTSFQGEKGLKIESSSWTVAHYQGKLHFVENRDVASQLDYVDRKGLTRLPSFQVLTRPVSPKIDASRATVVLSMNQHNSYVAYSHEILTFLLMGVDVIVYDNAGKGLSKGRNSHEGMTEAVDVVGRYLINGKGIDPSRVLFKGQCAGGFSASKAMERYKTHGWIDQAPRTFSTTAANVAESEAQIAAKKDSGWIRTLSRIIPYTKPLIAKTSAAFLPAYDVVESFSKTNPNALKIYTIGIPDEQGNGGDKLVPVEERDSIKESLKKDPNGHYLTISGGTHVTDWWTDPNVLESVTEIFKKFSLSGSLFPEVPKTPQQVFEVFAQKTYDARTLTTDEKSILEIFEAVEREDFATIDHIMNWRDAISPTYSLGLRDFLSSKERNRLLNDAISFSKTLDHRAFTEKLMRAKIAHKI